ncbi:MAG: hypothetical protein KJ921_06975 [Proteobacteria bacterium]|nr:hypothetical protein [Pseudomonadota bacterium]
MFQTIAKPKSYAQRGMMSKTTNDFPIATTIITAIAVIVSSFLSAYLTHLYGVDAIKETAKIEANNIVTSAKYNLDAVRLTNKNSLDIATINNENSLKLVRASAKAQKELAEKAGQRQKEERALKAAKYFFSDITVKMDQLNAFYTSLKNLETDLGGTHPIHSIIGFGGALGVNQFTYLPSISSSNLQLASELNIYTEIKINQFFSKLGLTIKVGKALNRQKFNKFISDLNLTGPGHVPSIEDQKKMAKLVFSFLNIYFYTVKSSILMCIEAGNEALININTTYLKDKKIKDNTVRREKGLEKERKDINQQIDKASSSYKKLVKEIIPIYRQALDKGFIDSFGSKLD